MLKFLLQQLEKNPQPWFSKKKLLSVESEGFKNLLKNDILVYSKPASNIETVTNPRCQHGCSLMVEETDDGLQGVCITHPEEDPVQINEDDLNRYHVSVENFLLKLTKVNDITNAFQKLHDGWFYAGYKEVNDKRAGFVFLQDIAQIKVSDLLGIKKISEDTALIVLTPFSNLELIDKKKILKTEGIISASLSEKMDLKTLKLPVDRLIEDAFASIKGGKLDRIEFLDRACKGRSRWVKVNEHEVKVPYSELIFLMYLAMASKKKRKRWVSGKCLEKEEITRDSIAHVQRLLMDLRRRFDGKFYRKVDEVLQNDGKSNYHLSIDPSCIAAPNDNWLLSNYRRFKGEVLKERSKREMRK